ncbi:helix-turn-helix protein [Pseudoduganella flava]|uniref:Helix-turn-helix domain-containing protein n=1 Tax=Pseudoduganella flava TaxID=871742 RepID=A0A562PGX6_9BURK|nr:helix-turn-helix domain-containing protein [Pseudoduganella flava]QGZ42483.1 helix-turn-helix domain-containing protein [Pseudoduganella flava]TWI43628.1 helix-turn-helix protein [Pseudoduganella flava]
MTTHPPATLARLVAPRVALASCVRGYLLRSTLDAPPLTDAQRLNRFPATPFCAITWMIAGSGRLVEPAIPDAVAGPGDAIFSGPRTQPCITGNPGPVHTLTVLFFADALHRLTGIDMAAQIDRMTMLDDVLDASWQELSARIVAAPDDDARIVAAPDDDARIGVFEEWLEPRWRAARGDTHGAWAPVRDWLQALAVRAVAAGVGRSARMTERRVRAWTGHPLRTLRRLARVEESLLAARDDEREGRVSLSDVAARSGYADQAHLSREARELIGTSPRELIRLARTDESYWLYRIWS